VTTVFTLPGAFSYGNMTTVQGAFGGPQALLKQLGDNSTANVVPVPYNDWDTLGGYIDGAAKLNAKLNALPAGEQVVALGHSFGSVALAQWLREYGPTSEINPESITFVLAANSIRPTNGLSTILGLYEPAGPVSTKWKVADAARQYDKWADYPNNWSSPYYWPAYNNVNTGDNATGSVNGVPNNIHNSYEYVNLTDPTAAQTTIGTVTFLLFETEPPNLSGATRAEIETAYNRVVSPTW